MLSTQNQYRAIYIEGWKKLQKNQTNISQSRQYRNRMRAGLITTHQSYVLRIILTLDSEDAIDPEPITSHLHRGKKKIAKKPNE